MAAVAAVSKETPVELIIRINKLAAAVAALAILAAAVAAQQRIATTVELAAVAALV